MRRAALVAMLWLSASALANELRVDRRRIQVNDTITVTVVLEGDFAARDSLPLRVQNLQVIGEPSTSSEYGWINGQSMRRKIFVYRVRPLGPGPAMVGPVVLTASQGQIDTLQAIVVQVMPDRAAGSNDPAVVVRELEATGRDPFFLVAAANKTEAYVGEQIVVTWTLYNGASVQQWQIADVPKLTDFWSDELEFRSVDAEGVLVGESFLQMLPIRRVALFPLHSGTLTVGGMTVDASIMRRVRSGPFNLFEGSLVDINYTSAPLRLNVKPLPVGAKIDAVGTLTMNCSPATQRSGGPVVIDVVLRGRGNLRAAARPRFAGNVRGTVDVEEGRVVVERSPDAVAMERLWKFIVFPRHEGMFDLPPIVENVFDPATAETRTLRCEAQSIFVSPAKAMPAAGAPAGEIPGKSRRMIVLGVLAALGVGIAGRAYARARASKREVRELVEGRSPAEIRSAVDAWLEAHHVKPNATPERAEAYRALQSLLDALERERLDFDRDELEARVRDVIR